MKINEFLNTPALNEIKMSPERLGKTAVTIDARIGIEFEMVVPFFGKTIIDADEGEENDYSYNPRPSSLDEVDEFFSSLPPVQYNRLRKLIRSDWDEYVEDLMLDRWKEERTDYIFQYITNNVSGETIRDEMNLNPEDELTDEIIDDYLVKVLRERDYNDVYSDAKAEFMNYVDVDATEEDYLNNFKNFNSMQDISDYWTVPWPHKQDFGDGVTLEDAIKDAADDFGEYTGNNTRYSKRYHGCTRGGDWYCAEVDSSIKDNQGRDLPYKDQLGVEFVSPPQTLEKTMQDLKEIQAWARERGCKTNQSTGLHINISLPNFSEDKIDYIKLALLLGDKYVLSQFEREGNTYARSALEFIKYKINANPAAVATVMDQMRSKLDQIANKIVVSQTEKHTSINLKANRIEFRSPGNNWLDTKFADLIVPTMHRFIVALDAAMDPEKYREEYLKKLYQIITSASKTATAQDIPSLFREYTAGNISREELIQKVRSLQTVRKQKQQPNQPTLAGGINPDYWEVVDRQTGEVVHVMRNRYAQTNRSWTQTQADEELRFWAAMSRRDPDLYTIRPEVNPPQNF
jgi:hypothetical protein